MARKATARFKARVDGTGRVLIPAEIRKRLGMKPGATVTITEGPSGRVVLEPALALLREAQEYFRSIAPASALWSDELIAERRKEAQREVED
jgi:AbrB family looped-hinge helix DNA binding protein